MAKKLEQDELLRLARLGALARLEALERERAAILKSFPGIQRGNAARTATSNDKPRRRRGGGMSSAGRKAVSARMKKYWANWRKEHGK
jgi:hypothetical protein